LQANRVLLQNNKFIKQTNHKGFSLELCILTFRRIVDLYALGTVFALLCIRIVYYAKFTVRPTFFCYSTKCQKANNIFYLSTS